MITLPENQWRKILVQLQQDYPYRPSMFLLRNTMKRVLGFTVRNNTPSWDVKTGYTHTVSLDFFDEHKKTMFILRYL
jgi:hypothetical protein